MIQESCNNLAIEGLRTLVIAQKVLEKEKILDWLTRYKQMSEDLNTNEDKLFDMLVDLESDMELLGVTGVEDKLQEDVDITLEKLRNAGICVWMLTGDKLETAKCIAISSGLKDRKQEIQTISGV